jgi:hypothetical protein
MGFCLPLSDIHVPVQINVMLMATIAVIRSVVKMALVITPTIGVRAATWLARQAGITARAFAQNHQHRTVAPIQAQASANRTIQLHWMGL